MAKVNVSIPQGTRDFGPDVVRKRNYIFDTIKNVFELYGFEPLETPAMENIETLMGKYGDEGDKLIFKILNNGLDNPDKEQQSRTEFEKILKGKNTSAITERALKYDLTIPFARYVAMNHKQLTFPFKRYQVQPVWRADKPQRGRYREFYQCDADIVGSNSLLNEVELLQIIIDVFKKLQINVKIHFNNRKVLAGISEIVGERDKLIDITIALDKIEKIGIDKAVDELATKGIDTEKRTRLKTIVTSLLSKKQGQEMVAELRTLLKDTQTGQTGVDEVEKVFEMLGSIHNKVLGPDLTFDISLARGLNYYTGSIIEVKAKEVKMGSICGGGRYDDLTGLFGVPHLPGVGISFGVDRIYDVMEELKLFPEAVHVGTQVLFFNLGEKESQAAFSLMQQLRNKNIRSELYHEQAKFDKQFKYAERKNIPYIIIIGSKELEEKTCVIKDIRKGEQQTIPAKQLAEFSFQ